jgi:hypothetical protein
MIKSKGRKILGVFIFCFISIGVFGTSENVLRNDLPLLLSKTKSNILSNKGFENLSIQTTELLKHDNGPTWAVIMQGHVSHCLGSLNYLSAGKVQLTQQTFISLTSFPFRKLALGYFMMVLNPSITQSI